MKTTTMLIALVLCAVATAPAQAHSFYEPGCCSDKDCGPVPFDSVKVTPQGYAVHGADGVTLIPFTDTRVKVTPPEDPAQRYHVCRTAGRPDGRILCIYVPQGGA